nr:hypothetical protein [Streptomyces sp. TSRI0107]
MIDRFIMFANFRQLSVIRRATSDGQAHNGTRRDGGVSEDGGDKPRRNPGGTRKYREEPGMCLDGHIRTAYSAAVRDSTRNPDRALGEATEIRNGVHPLVASFRQSWVDVHRKVVAGATEVKTSTSVSHEAALAASSMRPVIGRGCEAKGVASVEVDDLASVHALGHAALVVGVDHAVGRGDLVPGRLRAPGRRGDGVTEGGRRRGLLRHRHHQGFVLREVLGEALVELVLLTHR